MSGRVAPPNISQRTRLSDDVTSYIRELIMAGELRPGQVVNIDSFAREIGVSATPVREALMVLVSEGFLQTEKHRGFTVAPLSRQDIIDLFEVHATIGGELAARATAKLTPELLSQLEDLQERLEGALQAGDVDTADAVNTEFHETIVEYADSAKLAWLFQLGVRFVPTSVFYSHVSSVPPEKHHSIRDHRTILAAMRAGDPSKARDAMYTHISHSSELLLNYLEEVGIWDDEVEEPAEANVTAG